MLSLQLDGEGFLVHGELPKYMRGMAKDKNMKELVFHISELCERGANRNAKGIRISTHYKYKHVRKV